ncbi:MAG: hypothetical protein ABL884_08250 [Methyloglobulus sp.]
MSNLNEFAKAIALRISDEWNGKNEFPEDAVLLQSVLEKLLINNPDDCRKLIGTGIIEKDYFEKL